MSAQAAELPCPSCGAEVAEGARFCPQCGRRVDADATATEVAPIPPNETGPVPVETARAEPHLFGITPPTALLVLTLAAIAVAVVLFAAAEPLAGILVLLGAVLLFGAFAGVGLRKPDSRLARTSAGAVAAARTRAGLAAMTFSARSGARRRAARLRAEIDALRRERRARLSDFGGAVYGGDEAATQSLRSELERVDEQISAKESEMLAVVAETEESVRQARFEVQATEMVEVPEPPSTPEPYPPPGEADPPEPARVPEPYPPPDEGEPPDPAPVPEPEPGGPDRESRA